MSSSDSAMRCGASKKTSVRTSPASSATRARRSPSRAGRNPSKENLSVGRPAMLSAAVIAEGPGTATTLMPSCVTRRTSSNPGSESSGVPASLTSAMRVPARNFSSSSSIRSRSLCSCSDTSGRDNPSVVSNCPVLRVSSAATSSAAASSSRARGDRSPRLPMGVEITARRPKFAATIILHRARMRRHS